MRTPKVYVLVICAHRVNNGEYDMLSNTIKETWGSTETENAKIFYLWGKNYVKKDANDYVSNVSEGYGALLFKTLDFFKNHIQDDFDYIFRTNVGSYVHTQRIVDWLMDCPKERFYAGAGGNHNGIDFASGSGFFLSKDLVKLSVEKMHEFGKDHIDDVSFGRFMMKNGIKRSRQFMRITNHTGGLILQVDDDVCPEPLFDYNKNYHWRLRSHDGNRGYDANTMRELYKEFNP